MKKSPLLFVLVIFVVLVGFGIYFVPRIGLEKKTLNMVVVENWGKLISFQKSTLVGEMILLNVYEPLVQLHAHGAYQAALANEWEVSDDFRSIEFKINPQKKFSDGSEISSSQYKKAILSTLNKKAIYKNKFTLGLLRKLKGFEDYETTGEITGIETPDQSTLVFRFQEPYPNALYNLSSIHFSIFKDISEGKASDQEMSYIGTGPYRFKEIGKNSLLLEANPHHEPAPAVKEIRISGLNSKAFKKAICTSDHDLYYIKIMFSEEFPCKKEVDRNQYSEATGSISGQEFLLVNGMGNNLLSDLRKRQLFQKLVYQFYKKAFKKHENKKRQLDEQFFYTNQPGRLSESEMSQYTTITESEKKELVTVSKTYPLTILSLLDQPIYPTLLNFLKEQGITVGEESKVISYKEFAKIDSDPNWDLTLISMGLVPENPDGLYPLLGKYGKISFKSTARPSVHKALEKVRTPQNGSDDQVHENYKMINHAILQEVPAIHLSYGRDSYLYNHDRFTFHWKGLDSIYSFTNFYPN